MKIPKLARAAFETEMLSAAKHGHECLLTHAEYRENTQKFLSEVFKCFLTAEDTCFPTSRLTVFASLANVEIKDSIGRIWSRWGIYPKATMGDSLVVSLSPDQKTVGVWSINDNVLFATVSVPDWSIHDELTKVTIETSQKSAIAGRVRTILRRRNKEAIDYSIKRFPNHFAEVTMSDSEELAVRADILTKAMTYDQGIKNPTISDAQTLLMKQFITQEKTVENIMKLAEDDHSIAFFVTNDDNLHEGIKDSTGKSWHKFRKIEEHMIATCVEDGTIASFHIQTLLMEWYITPEMQVHHATITNSRQIVRKDLFEAAFNTLTSYVRQHTLSESAQAVGKPLN